jgi:hypothetical protein
MKKRMPMVALALAVGAAGTVFGVAQKPVLKIVVIEGEDGVNIIDKKTAVKPIVEVRDQNDLPVAGVPVQFAISGKSAALLL